MPSRWRLSKKWQSHFFEWSCTKFWPRFLAKLSAKISREVSFPRRMSSEMMGCHFIPPSACARRRVSERNRRKAAALGAEMTAELLAGGLF